MPPRVDPGPPGPPAPVPSDATVLFDGTGLSAWRESPWRIVDGTLEAGPGNLVSRESFGDFHLHVEWMTPAGFKGEWYDQGNKHLLRAPEFAGGTLVRPARVTVLHNGVGAQWDTEIHGETGHRLLPEYKSRLVRGPIQLSGHNCPVRFRNIWIRPLR